MQLEWDSTCKFDGRTYQIVTREIAKASQGRCPSIDC